MKIEKSKLILTADEKMCLSMASKILDDIDHLMTTESVGWSIYDGREIFSAINIIEKFVRS